MENAPISSGDSEDVLGFQELANLSDAEKIDKEKTREEKMAEAFSRCQSAYEEVLKEVGDKDGANDKIFGYLDKLSDKLDSLGIDEDDYNFNEEEIRYADAGYYAIAYVLGNNISPEGIHSLGGRYEYLPSNEMRECTVLECYTADKIIGNIGFFASKEKTGADGARELKRAVLETMTGAQMTGEGQDESISSEDEWLKILVDVARTNEHAAGIIARATQNTIQNFDTNMGRQYSYHRWGNASPFGAGQLCVVGMCLDDDSKKDLQKKLDGWVGRAGSNDEYAVNYGLERLCGRSPLMENPEQLSLENVDGCMAFLDRNANMEEKYAGSLRVLDEEAVKGVAKNPDAVRWIINNAVSQTFQDIVSEKDISETIEGSEKVADLIKTANRDTRRMILACVYANDQQQEQDGGPGVRELVFGELCNEMKSWCGDDVLPLLMACPDLLTEKIQKDSTFADSYMKTVSIHLTGADSVSTRYMGAYRRLSEDQIRQSLPASEIRDILIHHNSIDNPKIALLYFNRARLHPEDEAFYDENGFDMDAILHAGRIDLLLDMPDFGNDRDVLSYEDLKQYINNEKVPQSVRDIIKNITSIKDRRTRLAITALLTCQTSDEDETPLIDSKYLSGELDDIDTFLGEGGRMLAKMIADDGRFMDGMKLDNMRQIIIEDGLRGLFDEDGVNDSYYIYRFARMGSQGYTVRPETIGHTDAPLNDPAEKLLRGEINEENILLALSSFMHYDADDWSSASEYDLKIKEAFQSAETKDLALAKIRELYESALEDPEHIPNELIQLYKSMSFNEGAGPLTQIESNLSFIGELIGSKNKDSLAFAKQIEDRFSKEKWGESDKSEFYGISAEIMHADPELFNEFAALFTGNELSKKDFSTFVKEVYPLYRAKLVLLSRRKDESNHVGVGANYSDYSHLDKEDLRNQLHLMLLPFNLQSSGEESTEAALAIVKNKVFEDIAGTFRERFGISENVIPESFSKEDGKAIEDMVLYLGNINDGDEKKEALIGYYLALHLGNKGDKWKEFRANPTSISPADFLEADKAQLVQEAIRASEENNPVKIIAEMGMAKERIGEFSSELQAETSAIRTGNIQTVDQRLQSLIGNIEELKDPDLYPDPLDKAKITVLQKYADNPKIIGSTAAKLWQQSAGKNIELTGEESAVAEDLLSMLADNGVEITAESISTHLQKGLKTIGLPFSLARTVEDTGAKTAIADLQESIHPTGRLISIFDKVGEEFKPHSGAIALTTDIDFLRNQIKKNEDKLTEEEKTEAEAYLEEIDNKLKVVQEIYDRAIRSFDQMEKQSKSAAPSVTAKLAEISRIVHARDKETTITSTCTSDMLTIIENMRACLSAKTNGCNNDTDLTFGEPYKFYVYSKEADSSKGSVSDEIVHFLPTSESEEGAPDRMSFVMDQVYGAKNKDIIVGHIGVIFKKARELKEKFPEAPISILITDASMSSCGVDLSEEQLKIELEGGEYDLSNVSIRKTKAIVDEPKSGYGDHYIEYSGGSARQAGKRSVSGIEIVF